MTSSKRKRQDWEHDPDYRDFPQLERKRSHIAEEENAEGPAVDKDVESIRAIVRKEFSADLAERTKQLFDIQTALCTAQETLARLRIVAASHYYTRSKLQVPVGRNDPVSKEQTRIHPAIKKLLGASIKPVTSPSRRRVSTPKQADATIGKPKPSVETPSKTSVEIPSNSLVETSSTGCSPVDLVPTSNRPSTSKPPELSNANEGSGVEAGGPRYIPPTKKEALHCNKKRRVDMMIQKRLLVGNISRWLVADSREDRASHRWMIYVRFMDNERPDRYISRVRYLLHPSYKPNDVVEVTAAPFHLSRRGWGEFQVRVQVHFRNAADKPLDIRHNVKLDKTRSGRDTLGSETHVNVWLHSDNLEIIRQPDEEGPVPLSPPAPVPPPPPDPEPTDNDNASSSSRPPRVASNTSTKHSVPPSKKRLGSSPALQDAGTSTQGTESQIVDVADFVEHAGNGSAESSSSLPTETESGSSAYNGWGPAEFGFKLKEELLEDCGDWEARAGDFVHDSEVWDKSCGDLDVGNEDIANFAKDNIGAMGVLDLYKNLFPCEDTSVQEEIVEEEIVYENIVGPQNQVVEEIIDEEIINEEIVEEEIINEEIVEEEIVETTEMLNTPTFSEPLLNALVKPVSSDVMSSAVLPVNNTIIVCDHKSVNALDHRTQTEPTKPVLIKIMQPNGLFVYLSVNPKNIRKSNASDGTDGNIVVNSLTGITVIPTLNSKQQNGVKTSQVFSKPTVAAALPAVYTPRQDSQLNISAPLNNLPSMSTETSIESLNSKLKNERTNREKTVILPNTSKDSAYKTLKTSTKPHVSLQNPTPNNALINGSKAVSSTNKSAHMSNPLPTLTPISRSLLQKTAATVLGKISVNPSAIGRNQLVKNIPIIPSSSEVQQRTLLSNGAKSFQASGSQAQHSFPIRGGTSLLKSQSLLKSAHVAPVVGNIASLGPPVAGNGGSVCQPLPGNSGSLGPPVAGKSGSVYQPVAESSGSVRQPLPGKSGSVCQPVAGSSGNVYQPVAGSSGSVRQPLPENSGSIRQPLPGKSVSAYQPVAGSSGIGRVPGRGANVPVTGHALIVPGAANRAGAQVAAVKGKSRFSNGYGTRDESGALVFTPEKSVYKSKKPAPPQKRLNPTQVIVPRTQALPVDNTTFWRQNYEDLMAHVQVHCARIDDMRHAVKVVAVRLPLVDPSAVEPHFRAVHPYCAPSARAFMQWPAPKRACAEWLRAKKIQRCLLKCVRSPSAVWSTRHIAEYVRLHGFTPTCVDSELEPLEYQSPATKLGARLEPVTTCSTQLEPVSASRSQSEPVPGLSTQSEPVPGPSSRPDPVYDSWPELVSATSSQTKPVSASSSRTEPVSATSSRTEQVSAPGSRSDPAPPASPTWSIPFRVLEWLKARPPRVDSDPVDSLDDDGEEIDVVSVPTGSTNVRIPCAEVTARHADTLRMTHEQQFLCEFVRNTARLVDVDFLPEEIAPGTTFRAAESVMWMAVRSLVDDLTRRSFCKAWEKNPKRPPRDILPRDVRAAVSSRKEFDFLTNSDLGIRPTDRVGKRDNNSGNKEQGDGGRKSHD